MTEHLVLLTILSLCVGTVAIVVAVASLVRQARALSEKELRRLETRLARLEACEQRRFMQLNKPPVSTDKMQEGTAETSFPIVTS